MPLPAKLAALLNVSKAQHEALSHRVVYTAFDLAATLHIPLVDVIKTLLIKTDKGFAIALLSAAHQLDLKKFARAAGAKKATLPKEHEMVRRFKVKKGPLASFGSLYQLPVYIDRALVRKKKALFSLGSFRESLLFGVKDFLRIENPIVGVFGKARLRKKQKKVKVKKTKTKNVRRKS